MCGYSWCKRPNFSDSEKANSFACMFKCVCWQDDLSTKPTALTDTKLCNLHWRHEPDHSVVVPELPGCAQLLLWSLAGFLWKALFMFPVTFRLRFSECDKGTFEVTFRLVYSECDLQQRDAYLPLRRLSCRHLLLYMSSIDHGTFSTTVTVSVYSLSLLWNCPSQPWACIWIWRVNNNW